MYYILNDLQQKFVDFKYTNKEEYKTRLDNIFDYLKKELNLNNPNNYYNYYNNDDHRNTLKKLSEYMIDKNYSIDISLVCEIINKLFSLNKNTKINDYFIEEYFCNILKNILTSLLNNFNNNNNNDNINNDNINNCVDILTNIISFYIINYDLYNIYNTDENKLNYNLLLKKKIICKNIIKLFDIIMIKNIKNNDIYELNQKKYNLINIYILYHHMNWVKMKFKNKDIYYFKIILNNKYNDILIKITDEIYIDNLTNLNNLFGLKIIIRKLLFDKNINSFKLIYKLFYYKNPKNNNEKNEFIKNCLFTFVNCKNYNFDKDEEALSSLMLFLKNMYDNKYMNNEITTQINNYLISKFGNNPIMNYIYLKSNNNFDNIDKLIQCLTYINNKNCGIINIKKDIFTYNNDYIPSEYIINEDKLDSYTILYDNLLYDKLKNKLQYDGFSSSYIYYENFTKIFIFLNNINNLKFLIDNKNIIPQRARIFINLVKNHLKKNLCNKCNKSDISVIPAYCLGHNLCINCYFTIDSKSCPINCIN